MIVARRLHPSMCVCGRGADFQHVGSENAMGGPKKVDQAVGRSGSSFYTLPLLLSTQKRQNKHK